MNFLWLIRTESYKRGMVLSVLFNIIAKAILFLLTILVAAYFGSGIKTDIYFFVYGTMVLLSGFINAIDASVLIPESMRIREKGGDAAATAFLNFFFRAYLVIGLLFTVLMYFFGTAIFGWVSKFAEADILLYKNYFLLGSLYFLFMVLTNYLNTILSSLKFFTVPMIISGINSCIVITGILLLHSRYDVLSIFIGGITAYCVNLLLLVILLKRNAGWNFFTASSAITKKLWGNICFAESGQLATLASSFLPLFVLSGFGKGMISVMNYGKNIADIPNTLITAQLTNVSGIQMNEQAARQDHVGMNENFVHTGKLLLFILIPVACYLFVFAEPIVQVFYSRGNFSAGAATDAAGFLRLLSVTVFSIGINALVTRVFIATQAIKQAFIYQVILNIILIAAIWSFTTIYGAWGYPYGLILMSGLNLGLMYFICKRIAPWINYRILLNYTALLLLIHGAIGAGFYFVAPCLHSGIIARLLTGFFIYLIIIYVLMKQFQLNPAKGETPKDAGKRTD